MNLFHLPLLMGAPPADGGAGSTLFSFLPLVAIIAIFYLLILRPQRTKQQETQKMLSALKKGDRVITIGGIHGVIQTIRDNSVIVKVDENTKLEFSRSAIASVSSRDDGDDEGKKD